MRRAGAWRGQVAMRPLTIPTARMTAWMTAAPQKLKPLFFKSLETAREISVPGGLLGQAVMPGSNRWTAARQFARLFRMLRQLGLA